MDCRSLFFSLDLHGLILACGPTTALRQCYSAGLRGPAVHCRSSILSVERAHLPGLCSHCSLELCRAASDDTAIIPVRQVCPATSNAYATPSPPPPPAEAPPCLSTGSRSDVVFLTTVFMVRNLTERDCVPIVEGHRGCVMLGMSPPAHNNIMLATATHCCLF